MLVSNLWRYFFSGVAENTCSATFGVTDCDGTGTVQNPAVAPTITGGGFGRQKFEQELYRKRHVEGKADIELPYLDAEGRGTTRRIPSIVGSGYAAIALTGAHARGTFRPAPITGVLDAGFSTTVRGRAHYDRTKWNGIDQDDLELLEILLSEAA